MLMQVVNSEMQVVLEKEVPFKKRCRVSTRKQSRIIPDAPRTMVVNNN